MKFHLEKTEGEWRITLDENFTFSACGKAITIPKGFSSDGMSVPRILWPLLSPQFDPCTLEASVCHDWLYASHAVGRKQADTWYREALINAGYGKIKAYIVYRGLRLFGASHY